MIDFYSNCDIIILLGGDIVSFSTKLYELRAAKGISQKELADALGVAQSSINYWEKGQRDPSITIAQKVADFFNITIDEMIGWDPQKTVGENIDNLFFGDNMDILTNDSSWNNNIKIYLNFFYSKNNSNFAIKNSKTKLINQITNTIKIDFKANVFYIESPGIYDIVFYTSNNLCYIGAFLNEF